jgi:hypothetical protein
MHCRLHAAPIGRSDSRNRLMKAPVSSCNAMSVDCMRCVFRECRSPIELIHNGQ